MIRGATFDLLGQGNPTSRGLFIIMMITFQLLALLIDQLGGLCSSFPERHQLRRPYRASICDGAGHRLADSVPMSLSQISRLILLLRGNSLRRPDPRRDKLPQDLFTAMNLSVHGLARSSATSNGQAAMAGFP